MKNYIELCGLSIDWDGSISIFVVTETASKELLESVHTGLQDDIRVDVKYNPLGRHKDGVYGW